MWQFLAHVSQPTKCKLLLHFKLKKDYFVPRCSSQTCFDYIGMASIFRFVFIKTICAAVYSNDSIFPTVKIKEMMLCSNIYTFFCEISDALCLGMHWKQYFKTRTKRDLLNHAKNIE